MWLSICYITTILQVVYGLINDRRRELSRGVGPARNDLLNALLISVDDDGQGALQPMYVTVGDDNDVCAVVRGEQVFH